MGVYVASEVVKLMLKPVNPVNVVEVLEQFPVEKLQEINWMIEAPSHEWFNSRINQIIPDILDGSENSLHK